MSTMNLRFMIDAPRVTPSSRVYQLPCFPPPDDWPISIDEEGNELSRYGDSEWDYSALTSGSGFRVIRWNRYNLSDKNLRLVKAVMLLYVYHHYLFPGKIKSLKRAYGALTMLARVCDENGILISELSRFPQVQRALTERWSISFFEDGIAQLHKLYVLRDELGFTIADEKSIRSMASMQKAKPEHRQTPYIPPRIWSYQVARLSEAIEDYLANEEKILKALSWLSEVYAHNMSLGVPPIYRSPFTQCLMYKQRILYKDGFRSFLRENGLFNLFDKWLPIEKIFKVTAFSTYLNLVRDASIFYIMSFSLQRTDEACSLRSDCLSVENDPKLGNVYLVCGETTKTDPDDDARWVVPEHVKKAVDAASSIARWRSIYVPKKFAVKIPFLTSPGREPWAGGKRNTVRERANISYSQFLRNNPDFFERGEITIQFNDRKIALSMTPDLVSDPRFNVGCPWPLACHQLRRTTNVNMFASGMISDSSLQWAMKHQQRQMTLYYGRNYTSLKLNAVAQTSVIVEYYRAIYEKLVSVVNDTDIYVNPHPKDATPKNLINLVEEKDEKRLSLLLKKGLVGCRETLLGICMKGGTCEYGGIESVSKCAVGDGGGICTDARFDKRNEQGLTKLKEAFVRQLGRLDMDSPRAQALKHEIYAIEVYLNVINRKKVR